MVVRLPNAHQMFQSTHPHGVRQKITSQFSTHFSFNPRTHTGCDDIAQLLLADGPVSIHAPTRGATFLQSPHLSMPLFQSTHPHGVRLLPYSPKCYEWLFQSTHPHGVRLYYYNVKIFRKRFQSTHPHGVRPPSTFTDTPADNVSIHAPTRGATNKILI